MALIFAYYCLLMPRPRISMVPHLFVFVCINEPTIQPSSHPSIHPIVCCAYILRIFTGKTIQPEAGRAASLHMPQYHLASEFTQIPNTYEDDVGVRSRWMQCQSCMVCLPFVEITRQKSFVRCGEKAAGVNELPRYPHGTPSSSPGQPHPDPNALHTFCQ